MAKKKKTENPENGTAPAKHPGGRPTDYRPEYCERVIELGKDGKLPAQMAADIGVTKQTLHEWARTHSEFSDAFDKARVNAEAWHLEKATETAIGQRGGNAPMAKFLLSAAFGYRETSGVEHSGEIHSRPPVDPSAALSAAKHAEEAGEV
jgi:hypothetical protein